MCMGKSFIISTVNKNGQFSFHGNFKINIESRQYAKRQLIGLWKSTKVM